VLSEERKKQLDEAMDLVIEKYGETLQTLGRHKVKESKEEMITTFKTAVDYPGQAKKVVTLRTNGVELDDLLQEFEDHLKGCGFCFDGHVTIVDEE
jgi:hypothetical protein